jgi:hypothetical protein
MPPVERFVCRFAAEPPQESLPHGSWAQTLQAEFLAACLRIDAEGQELGEARELRWFPDRTWNGRTYVPVTSRTTTELELFGYVSFVPGDPEGEGVAAEPSDFVSRADFTVWGVPLLSRAIVATAELAGLAVDQCALVDDRFTLVAPDNYRGDFLDVKLWDADGRELASESLYVDDDEADDAA